jgi:hypothetical protein
MKKSKFIDYNVILAILSHRNRKQREAIDDLSRKLSGGKVSDNNHAELVINSATTHGLSDRRIRA